ncbi:MAG: V-type ATP synthase subunit E [Oscillospiraceae bacterium]|nr:V-type ATP synthase subunit E [Oscillospiraceae bacterium]
MNGLEKITERIARDGQAEVDAILAEAGKRIEVAQAGFQAQAAQMTADAEDKRQRDVAERLERQAGSADMERRQMLLSAKQGCIDEAFAKAADALRALPRDEYISLLAKLAADNGADGQELILSAADHDAVGEAVVAAANALKPGAAFTLSDETRDLGGGVVLKKGPVEINCAFETMLRQLRQELASDVAHVLFD